MSNFTTINSFIRDGEAESEFSVLPGQTGFGTVNAILPLPDGKIFISGNIPSIAGIATRDIVKLNSDGTPDLTFNTGTGSDGSIQRLHLQSDGKILASGRFNIFNGIQRSFIVRLNPDGSVDETFRVTSDSTQNLVVCDILSDGRILVCGNFTTINGIPRRHLAVLTPSGSVDLNFNFNDLASIYINAAKFLPDNKILVGGVFNLNTTTGIKRLNSDGSIDQTFAPSVGFALVIDLKLLPDGKFIACNGGNQVRRFTVDGNPDPTFNADNNFQSVVRLVIPQSDGKILVGGDFSLLRIGTVTYGISRIARLNSDGSFDTTFVSPNDGSSGGINAISVRSDNSILIGGDFTQVMNANLGGLIKTDQNGVLDTNYQGRILKRGLVFAHQFSPDGKIVVGGNFNVLNLNSRKLLGRLDKFGNVDQTFVPQGGNETDIRVIIKQPDGKFLVGGTTSNTSNRAVWRLNADGSTDTTFNATFQFNIYVSVIAIQTDGKILVGGNFTTVNGTARQGVARLNTDGSLDSFNVNFGVSGGGVNGIIVQSDGKIVIGGGFFEINGNSAYRNIGRLNTDGSLDTTFIPNSGGQFIRVVGIHQIQNKIFVSGTFSAINSNSRSPLIRLQNSGEVDWSFNAGTLVGDVFSIASAADGKIYVGGEFNTFAESGNRKFIVRILENGSLDYTFDAGMITNIPNNPNTPANFINTVSITSGQNILISGSFDYIENRQFWGIAKLKLNSCVGRSAGDFDGDGKTDLAVYRRTNNVWYRLNSFNNQIRGFQFGIDGDKIVPADFDGDGRVDHAVFRPSNGTWYIFNSGNSSYRIENFGLNQDIPVPADFDGDGQADLAVFRPSNNIWYLLRSRLGFTAIQFGQAQDIPIPKDFDGDCQADLAVFRASVGEWWYLQSSDGQSRAFQFGSSTDLPIPGDYTGDGKTDIAFWRASNGLWFILRSEDYSYYSFPFGQIGDLPVSGDYDADGRTDPAVFRPSEGTWFVNRTKSGILITNFGRNGDYPIPAASFSP